LDEAPAVHSALTGEKVRGAGKSVWNVAALKIDAASERTKVDGGGTVNELAAGESNMV
jgi:hypothetical protein